MGTFVKEYGLIAVLTAVALSGYFLIGDRRGDIMEYTLDLMGTRLMELAQGDDEKQEIARQFAAFSERVERDEVAPEVIESVAANVLNLRARGAVITPEEAELMLYPEAVSTLPIPADSSATVPAPPAYSIASAGSAVHVDMKELGDRITYMFEFADAVGQHDDSGRTHVRFARDTDGIHVIMDPRVESFFETSSAGDLYSEMSEKEWVRWEVNLAEQQERDAKRLERQAERITVLENSQKSVLEVSQVQRLEALKRVQKLAMMGATTDLDTLVLYQEMESLLEGLTFELQTIVDTEETDVASQPGSVSIVIQSDSTSNR